jgi:PKD repeat protein
MIKYLFLIIAALFFLTPQVVRADDFTVSNPRMGNDGYLTVDIDSTPPDNICSWWQVLHFVYITDSNGNRVGGFGGCNNNGDGTYTMTAGQIGGYLPDTGTYRVEVNESEQSPYPYDALSGFFDWTSPLPHVDRAPSLTIPDDSRPLSDTPSLRQVYVDLGQAYSSTGYFIDPDSTSWTATVDYGDGGGNQVLPLDGYNFSLSHTYVRGGSYTVTVKVKDDQGVEGSIQRVVSVLDYDIQASNPRIVSGSFTVDLHGLPPDNVCSWFPAFRHDAYVLDSSGQIVGGFSNCSSSGDGNYTVSGGNVGGQGIPPDGMYSIKLEEREQPPYPYGTITNSFSWTANYPPSVSAISDVSIEEGSTYSANGSFSDSTSSLWTATVDYGDGSGVQSLSLSGNNFALSHKYKDNGIYILTVKVTDNQGATGTGTAKVTLSSVAPSVSAITASINPVQVNISTVASAAFTDQGVLDTHTAVWNWGDGTTTSGTVTESNGSGSVSDSHIYTQAGVYQITLTVTDKDGGVGVQTLQYLSVYNPTSQGLFSAGQKYTSPAGAYPSNSSLTGIVKFGLSYKYQGTMPAGNRQFSMDFNQANIHFNASSVNSFVISNGVGTLTGTGTVNGSGLYNFLVTGNESANTIRIQIKDQSGNIIYDTQPGASATASPTTPVAGNVLAH